MTQEISVQGRTPLQSTQDHHRGPREPRNRATGVPAPMPTMPTSTSRPAYLFNYLLLISALLCITFRTGAVRGNTCLLMKKKKKKPNFI